MSLICVCVCVCLLFLFAAHENLVRTRTFGECRWPKMEVVYIDSSDRSKRYEPHATMLHRCNNRTACCHNDSLTCVAKRMERVTVVFGVFNVSFLFYLFY